MHTISFVVGPADSTGVQQLVLSADIEIVSFDDTDNDTNEDEAAEEDASMDETDQ